MISAFESINQVIELKVIRKLFNSNVSPCKNEIPNCNEIFAKHSIKLPVRSSNYEQPVVLGTKRDKFGRMINEILNNSDEKGKFKNKLKVELVS